MELLIAIAPILIVGVIGYVIISIQDWITDMRFYRRSTQRELNRLRRSLGKVECAKHTMPDTLGPGEIYIFDKEKVGKVTGSSLLCNEEMGEAEKLIKEAKEKRV